MRIAQLIIYKLPIMELSVTNTLTKTDRDKGCFGSTGTHEILKHVNNNTTNGVLTPSSAAAAPLHDTNNDDMQSQQDDHEVYNVLYSSDPFEDCQTIPIPIRDKHETQRLILTPCEVYQNRVKIIGVQPATSPRNMKQWIHRIKIAHLIKRNNIPVPGVDIAKNIFQDFILTNKNFNITVSMDQKISLHHEQGIPMLYFDQLTTIANRLNQIKTQHIPNDN